MNQYRDHDADDARLDAALRRALAADTDRLVPSAPPVAAVVRAGRRRARLRHTARGAALAAAVVVALGVAVPQLRSPDTPTAVSVAPASPAPASPSARPSTLLTLGSGTVDGIGWQASARIDENGFCQHLVIDGVQVDTEAGGYWTDCYDPGSAVDQGMGVHVAGGSGLRLLTGFGADRGATVVVTFSDGRTTTVHPVQPPGSATGGFVVPIAPGRTLAVVDVFDAHGTRVTHDPWFR
ncbi:hypothetical protein ABH931_006848 [Streptacidiphilus sp. MAP12-33]|uniref:hypothetical protein n=1 Tax=Streptacidiphilus sp. MAP12-33 TaxID=3156266 RepID=UPI0035148377